MPYRSAILGCGPRAATHIEAYDGLDNMTLTAACDMNAERLRNYGERFHIPGLYEDLGDMLQAEKPDVLHVVTPPKIREEPIELAAAHGVRAVVVEKPVALTIPQARAIREIADRTGVKVLVNTQRRYYQAFQTLKGIVQDPAFGEIRFMRMVTRGNILSWGPHVVDLILFLLDDVPAERVWATAYGMNGYEYGHPAPASMLMALVFPNDVMVYLEAADDAVGVPGAESFWMHAEFDVWGTRGRAWWTGSQGWGYQRDGDADAHSGPTGMDVEDTQGQREFTRAIGHWLSDEAQVHECCLEHALLGFDITMAAYLSAYTHKRIDFPAAVPDDITERIEQGLAQPAPASQ